ncbi:hypothetical protein [Hyphomicrobium sp. 2TAF46]|uniref:hypothetical protein n=1 Tax=Hyphomicrobium sp. 2TAF46 TaxID=3233019 RepID=UPI003F91A657
MHWTNIWRASCLLATVIASAFATARADDPIRVSGYFCGAKSDQVAFLQREAAGDSEEIAANTVNKVVGKQSCAFFLPAHAIAANDQTVISGGVVYKVQSFIFLPEKVERWTGTYFGSMQSAKTYSEL